MSHSLEPFTSDGCSGGMSWLWNKLFNKSPAWENHCYNHDVRYWIGGTWTNRWDADMELFHGVRHSINPILGHILAALMWMAVRVGGTPYLPTSYRWGYGHGYMEKTYEELNEFEQDAFNSIVKEKGIVFHG